VVKKLNIELHTFVVNWEEMKDLQRAFFKASLPDQDIPQIMQSSPLCTILQIKTGLNMY
jgi:hypothetical protein